MAAVGVAEDFMVEEEAVLMEGEAAAASAPVVAASGERRPAVAATIRAARPQRLRVRTAIPSAIL